MSLSARPRPLLASIVASVVWLGPWIVFLMIVSKRDNDNAVGYGLFLAAIPVALAVGALVWRIIGALLRDGPPPLIRFTIRGALLATGLVLAYQLWGAWGFWDSPRPPSWKEVAFLVLGQVLALGLTAVPAAVLWWKLGVRPTAAEFATASHDVSGS